MSRLSQNPPNVNHIVLGRGRRAPLAQPAALTVIGIAGAGDIECAGPAIIVRYLRETPHQLAVEARAITGQLDARRDDLGWTIDLATLPIGQRIDALLLCPVGTHDQTVPLLDQLAARAGASRRRAFVVAPLGWHENQWFDGPLAHFLPDGQIASYVPSGGASALTIPATLSPDQRGESPGTARQLEGSADQAHHRAMLAAVDDALPPDSSGLNIEATAVDRLAAVALTLARQARPDTPINLICSGGKPALSPPWRRFTENAAIVVQASTAQSPKNSTDHDLPLSLLTERLQLQNVAGLIRQINSISEILPKSLL